MWYLNPPLVQVECQIGEIDDKSKSTITCPLSTVTVPVISLSNVATYVLAALDRPNRPMIASANFIVAFGVVTEIRTSCGC